MTIRIRREPGLPARDVRRTTPKGAPRTDRLAYRSAVLEKGSHPALIKPVAGTAEGIIEVRRQEALLKTGALQNAIFNSANFSSIATDAKGVIQIFNVGAERMLGYAAADVMNKITPADISDPQEVIARAKALSVELGTPITPGFEALVFKASRGIEDIYELTYIRKDGSRFPAVVSVTALRDAQDAIIGYLLIGTDNTARKQAEEALLKAGALQSAIFNSANFSSIATDAKGVIQIFNVGAERMLGYTAADVMNKITPADISDPQEVIARAKALSVELGTPITPGFEALVFKASRGIEDIYELTYIRKDGSRFPAVVSVTALRDAQDAIIGYLLIGTDNTARKQAEEALLKAGALQSAIFNSANFSSIATDAKGVIQIFNVGAERMLGYTAAEVMNKITPADISDPQEVIARAKALSVELGTPITPGFEALVFKASRGIEDIYELTYIRKDGSRFPAVVSVTALRDAQDAIIGYLLIGTDNTARKQAEEALLKAGALQSAIFNSANFSSIATDAKGVIQIFNVGAERMLGYTAADVMNKITPADISDPQEVIARAKALSVELGTPITPGFEALVFKASRGIEDIYELTYIRKDGSRFPAVVSVTALRDAQDAIIGYLLIGTDNTARKQVEAEQKKLDQRLRDQQFYTRSLIESNIDALMTTDPRGIITDVNKQMEALTGCTRDELIGAPFKNYFTDPERAEAGIKLVLSEKKVTNYELTARARDGKQTVVSYNATTFYDRDRKLQGVFAAARDVTERKRFEQDAPGNERRAGERQVRGGEGQPREIGLPVQHEPRAAHPAQCDPRLRPADGVDLPAADGLPEGEHRPDPAGGLAPARADQRDPRSRGDRVRQAVAVAGTGVAGRGHVRMPGHDRAAGAAARHQHDLSPVGHPVLRRCRSDPGEAGAHQPALQRDQVQPGAGNGRGDVRRHQSGTHSHQRQGHRRGIASGKAGAALPAVQPSRTGGQRRGRHRHRPRGEQAAGRADGGVIGVESTVGVGSVFWFELLLTPAPTPTAASAESDSRRPRARADRRTAAHPALCRGQPGQPDAGRATDRAAIRHAPADRGERDSRHRAGASLAAGRDPDGHQSARHQRHRGPEDPARRPGHGAHPDRRPQRQCDAARHRERPGGGILPLSHQADQGQRVHGYARCGAGIFPDSDQSQQGAVIRLSTLLGTAVRPRAGGADVAQPFRAAPRGQAQG